MTRKKKPNGYWTMARCIASAKRYSKISEWQRAEGSAYEAARRNGWLDECCSHMEQIVKPGGYWTKGRCLESAKPYATRGEWKRADVSAYQAARRSGWLDECCQHMELGKNPSGYWARERCMESAKSYSSRMEWEKGEGGAYTAARKNGWFDECCQHMELARQPNGYWDKERCIESAKPYSARRAWKRAEGSAHEAARREGWIDDCCAHMESGGSSDFDAVYVWEIIDALGPTSIFKVGLTSWKLGERRIKDVADQGGLDYRLLGLCRTSKGDARIFEDFILGLGNRFTDVPDTFDGRTELRTFSSEAIGTIHHLLGIKEESIEATP